MKLLLTLLVSGWIGTTAAATYYVSDSLGLDANNGSATTPWKTIQYAVDTVSPGDTIIVKPGSYGRTVITKSGTAGHFITIKAETNVNVMHTPNGTKVHGDAGQWEFTYLDFLYSASNPSQVSKCKGFKLGAGWPYVAVDYIEIEGFEITNVGVEYDGGVGFGSDNVPVSYINIKNNFIHNLEPGLWSGTAIGGCGRYVTITGNTLWQVEAIGICITSTSQNCIYRKQ
jgi:hypothetical protein